MRRGIRLFGTWDKNLIPPVRKIDKRNKGGGKEKDSKGLH